MTNSIVNLKTTLTKVLAEELLSTDLFPVEIQISETGKVKIQIILDGDNGITIDQCAEVSRKLGAMIEENDWIDVPYILEVASAGVGVPLKLERQYAKNINRFLEIQTIENQQLIGKLIEVNEHSIQILEEVRRKKGTPKARKMQLAKVPTEILFSDIEQTIVKVMF